MINGPAHINLNPTAPPKLVTCLSFYGTMHNLARLLSFCHLILSFYLSFFYLALLPSRLVCCFLFRRIGYISIAGKGLTVDSPTRLHNSSSNCLRNDSRADLCPIYCTYSAYQCYLSLCKFELLDYFYPRTITEICLFI